MPLQSPQRRLTYRLMCYLKNYIKRPLCQNLYNPTPCFYRKRSRTTLKVCRTVRRSIRSKNDFGNRLSSLDITVKKGFLCKQRVIFHFWSKLPQRNLNYAYVPWLSWLECKRAPCGFCYGSRGNITSEITIKQIPKVELKLCIFSLIFIL